eukprot:scaffold260_cov274-Pinguiococcus_pyrenoidosus.AAC.21
MGKRTRRRTQGAFERLGRPLLRSVSRVGTRRWRSKRSRKSRGLVIVSRAAQTRSSGALLILQVFCDSTLVVVLSAARCKASSSGKQQLSSCSCSDIQALSPASLADVRRFLVVVDSHYRGVLDRVQLEVLVEDGHVVQRPALQVEPLKLVDLRILEADDALVKLRWHLGKRKNKAVSLSISTNLRL